MLANTAACLLDSGTALSSSSSLSLMFYNSVCEQCSFLFESLKVQVLDEKEYQLRKLTYQSSAQPHWYMMSTDHGEVIDATKKVSKTLEHA